MADSMVTRGSELRILHLTSAHRLDDVRIRIKICRTLAGKYDEVHLAGPGGDEASSDAVIVHKISSPRNRLHRMAITTLALMVKAVKLRPNLVHVHDPELLPVAIILRTFGIVVVYDAHEDLVSQVGCKSWIPVMVQPVARTFARVVNWISGRTVSAVITATPAIAACFPQQKTSLVRNFPIVREFPTVSPSDYFHRKDRIIYAGGLSWKRGLQEMVAAMR
ncbi:MAG: glycosyltransferase, partial [Acidimicrobiales bacterium]|nr:glycosyltransferase [Acidimicrobiales bacterium]